MPETKKVTEPGDPWKTPQETWQYVVIPEETPRGEPFPSIGLNKLNFYAGQTYKVPPQVAQYVNERIKVANRAYVRELSPRVDLEALRVIPAGSAPGGQPAFVDATQINTL